MKRVLLALVATLSLTVGVAGANAQLFPGLPFGGGSSPTLTSYAAVAGTVVSVDASKGTFVADAFVLTPPSLTGGGTGTGTGTGTGLPSLPFLNPANFPFLNPGSFLNFGGLFNGLLGSIGSEMGGFMSGMPFFGLAHDTARAADATTPATTEVTITTDSTTHLIVNGKFDAGVGDITAGDKFFAVYKGSPTSSISTLVASPPLFVIDHTPPTPHQLYAFVGSVTGVDTTAGTVTVNVTRSLPSSLVPSGSDPVPFTVGSDTLILGGSSGDGLGGSSLSDVSVGDIVAGGLVAPPG